MDGMCIDLTVSLVSIDGELIILFCSLYLFDLIE